MYLFKKEHLGSQIHNKNYCCITEEQSMDIHLGFLKHPKNAANLLTQHINHDYIQMFSPVYHLHPDTSTEY